MNQEEFAAQIDSATSKESIISIVDSFIDQSVIVPKLSSIDHVRMSGQGSEAHSVSGDSASDISERHAHHDLDGSRHNAVFLNQAAPEQQRQEGKGFVSKLLGALGILKKPVVNAVSQQVRIDVPQHIILQQRRRARIARDRNLQLMKFNVSQEGRKHDIEESIRQRWTHKEKRMFGLISLCCLGLVMLLSFWLGPSIKEKHRREVHEVHMHNFAGEVGGIAAVTRSVPHFHYLDDGDNVDVFDLKIVAQVSNPERAHEAKETLSVALWSTLDNAECFKSEELEIRAEVEAELLETIIPEDLWSASCTNELTNENAGSFYFNISTTTADPVAFMFQVDALPGHAKYRTALSAILLCLVYICIVTDIVHRTLVAMIGASLSLLLLATLDYHTSMQTAIVWMDEGTLALLFGMMIIVNLVSTTGLFEWVAIRALDMSEGKMTKLLVLLCISTAVLSAFLDNVTTMLLLAPVTIELCKVIDINPVPFLVSEVMYSNIGGTATMIGDPPNIIIGNMLSEDVGFVDFIVNLAPCILASSVLPIFLLMWYYSDTFNVPKKQFDIEQLKLKYKISDPVLLAKSGVILSTVLLLFFMHPLHHIDTSWVACVGAVALMTVATPHELHHVFESVEWDTLLFFAALFVMIEAMATMGLIRSIGDGLSSIIASAPEENRLAVAIVVILWVSSIVSGFLDNIPYTATMVPVVKLLSEDAALNLPLRPLVWSLSLGACLGGNLTLVGASANLVTAGAAEHAGHPIGFRGFMKVGVPVTFLSVTVATVYCILLYDIGGVGSDD